MTRHEMEVLENLKARLRLAEANGADLAGKLIQAKADHEQLYARFQLADTRATSLKAEVVDLTRQLNETDKALKETESQLHDNATDSYHYSEEVRKLEDAVKELKDQVENLEGDKISLEEDCESVTRQSGQWEERARAAEAQLRGARRILALAGLDGSPGWEVERGELYDAITDYVTSPEFSRK